MRNALRALMSPGAHGGAASFGLLLLRLAAGGLMVVLHGWGKFQAFGTRSATFPDPLGVGNVASMSLAVSAEVACAALLAVGLATRLVCIPLIVTMAVAAFVVHADDPLQKKELALMYLAPYLALLFTGAGRFSADGLIARR